MDYVYLVSSVLVILFPLLLLAAIDICPRIARRLRSITGMNHQAPSIPDCEECRLAVRMGRIPAASFS